MTGAWSAVRATFGALSAAKVAFAASLSAVAVVSGCGDGTTTPGSPLSVPPFQPSAPEMSVGELRADLERQCGGTLCVKLDWVGLPPDLAPDDTRCDVTGIEPTGQVERGSTLTVTLSCPGSG